MFEKNELNKGFSEKENIKELFDKRKDDICFSKVLDCATNDQDDFLKSYFEYWKENINDDKFLEEYDKRGKIFIFAKLANVMRRKKEGMKINKDEENIFEEAKELKDFIESLLQRKRDIVEKSQKIFDDLNVQECGTALNEKEKNELIENLAVKDPRILQLLIHYYVYERGEFFMTSSKELGMQNDEYWQRRNKRTSDIADDENEMKHVVEVVHGKLREIVEKSNNKDDIDKANEHNLALPSNYIPNEGDFLHGTTIDTLDEIRKSGFLCREIKYPEYAKRSMSQIFGGSVSFGRQTRNEIKEERREKNNYANVLVEYYCKNGILGKYGDNIASKYGAYDASVKHYIRTGEKIEKKSKEEELEERKNYLIDIKAAGDEAITYILKEQKDSYELRANTQTSNSDEYGVGIGAPSTEIKGIIVDATCEKAVRTVFAGISKYPFYIPVYDSETGVLINEDMKKIYQ